MNYVFDNSPLSVLYKNYYRGVFKTLWQGFDVMVDEGRILSTREVLREIEDSSIEPLRAWAASQKQIFATPTAAEATFVSRIYAVQHFQQNIELKKLLKGGHNADPFVIARAAVTGGTVVTMEQFKDNASKIPNICRHFGVPCVNLEQFMETEGWTF
jgi:Domain of unknown function (DUF4411)